MIVTHVAHRPDVKTRQLATPTARSLLAGIETYVNIAAFCKPNIVS